ncbi:SDR family oxidoreductase [Leptolyngbya sp. NK1-12]|uniref:SDR family oxidoreductase n=1 Tax=Leptolyngbya sp. NK1-12 TaxID=2547451 RepID=A0AA97AJL8_9CYAN|nr:SDR family oxidoreductase [Elainella sp. C42_A2020_010]RNJ66770.1 MAG: SDR family NAD(P)-dependent oxidoreductase [Leptolyngbya sp. IPPAS B-1204]WNZ27945.1 SDR family oxidoreductase [Leptolyngbya sp. NK1-12]
MQLKPISQQVVALIGASSGIGRVTALEFAKQGAKVVVSARSESGLNSLVDEIKQLGGEAIAIPADVADYEQVKAVADKTVNHYGRLDSWVHLAATSVFAKFEQLSPEEFRRVIEVNLMGQVYGAMVALPYLRQAGQGALIMVSSVEARRSLPLQSPYSASKHGIEGFLDSLRVELQHDNIPVSVTNVMPATINTPFYNKGLTKLGVKPTGVPPYYQPDLVARAILHVAEHPTRDIIVGDVGRVLDVMQKISPHLVDWVLQTIAIEGQHTQTPKQETDPNNLYSSIEDPSYNRAEGDYSNLAIPSFLDWFDWHPTAKWGVAAGLGALLLLTTQAFKDNDTA